MTTTTAQQHFDLIIIGTGSGNSIPGPEFDDKSIAIIEEGVFGGTCLNVGCIPTKMFVYAAETARMAREASRLNIDAEVTKVHWQDMVQRVFAKRIDPIAQGGEQYRRGNETPNITVFDRTARFVGDHLIETGLGDNTCIISGEQIVLAVGARPHIPEVIAEAHIPFYTNENIMRLPELPESLIIYGGGYIAAEFANIFSALGVQVTLVARSSRLLRHLDEDISARFTELLSAEITTVLGHEIIAATGDDSEITITLADKTTVSAQKILVATGRTPNGDRLDLDKTGVSMDGPRIATDEYGRTNVPGIWALGDCSSPYQLKHVANAEMRAVQHNLLHPDDLQKLPHEHVPAAVFSHPQIATVGLTEQEAREQGYRITVAQQRYGDVAFGWAMEDESHFAKLIADKDTGLLLGAHIIGPEASTLIQQLITAMVYELDMRSFARRQYWIHPALPELLENALLNLDFSS